MHCNSPVAAVYWVMASPPDTRSRLELLSEAGSARLSATRLRQKTPGLLDTMLAQTLIERAEALDAIATRLEERAMKLAS